MAVFLKSSTHLSRVQRVISVFAVLLLVSACDGGSSPSTDPVGVELSVNPPGAGTVVLRGEDDEGQSVEISATANVGFVFAGWTDDDGNPVSLDPTFETVVTGHHAFRANFMIAQSITSVSLPDAGEVIDFEIGHQGRGALFAVTRRGSDGGENALWRSKDRGETWNRVLSGPVRFVEVAIGDPDLVFAALDSSYRVSTDRGANWTSGEIANPVDGQPMTLTGAAMVTGESGLFVITADAQGAGLYKSTDYGVSWRHTISSADTGSQASAAFAHIEMASDPEVVYLATQSSDSLWKSVDGGESGFSIRQGLPTNMDLFSRGLRVNPHNPDQLLVMNYATVNGGSNWTSLERVEPCKAFWYRGGLVRFNHYQGIGYMDTSLDLGQSWTSIMPLLSSMGFEVYDVVGVHHSDEGIYFESRLKDSVTDRVFLIERETLEVRYEAR